MSGCVAGGLNAKSQWQWQLVAVHGQKMEKALREIDSEKYERIFYVLCIVNRATDNIRFFLKCVTFP